MKISLFLYGCGNGDMGTETTKMPNELTDQNQYSSTEAEESNELLGSWYSDAEGIVVIFSESGDVKSCILECRYNDNPTIEIFTEKYNLVEGNQLEIYSSDGSMKTMYNYNINEDVITLSVDSSDYDFSLNMVKRSILSENLLVGQWKLLSMGYIDSPSYKYRKSDVTFYSDDTFVSKYEHPVTEEQITTNDYYFIIHDGRTIETGSVFASYWDYGFLSDDIMLVTTDNSELLYIAQ